MMEPLIESNLNHLSPAWANTLHCLTYERVVELIQTRLPGFVVTEKRIEFETDFDARDMAWNHMDFSHRPCVHRHYTDGLRLALGKDVTVGFTPWKGTPLLIPTFDIRSGERDFFHGYNIAGFFYVFMKPSIVPMDNGGNIWRIQWAVVSKWYFRFLHRFLHQNIEKANRRLFEEDKAVKSQRKKLREKGYSFIRENTDFYSSTVLSPNNVSRPAAPDIAVPLSKLRVGQKEVLTTGGREFLALRTSSSSVLLWDNICPHQGGTLETGALEGDRIQCPWHGLRFSGTELSEQKTSREQPAFRATLLDGVLTISPRQTEP